MIESVQTTALQGKLYPSFSSYLAIDRLGSGSGRHRQPSNNLIDRIQPTRDGPRDYPPYRDDYGPPGGRYPPRDARYGYDYPPPPPPGRDYRRPPSPPRDHRDYPGGPPPPRRDYDDYRMRGPPPRPYDRSGFYPPDDGPAGYPRGYGPPLPLPRDPYDRYDRRPPPPADRYSAYPPGPPVGRPRTPPIGPPRGRDDFDRPVRYVCMFSVQSSRINNPVPAIIHLLMQEVDH